MKKGREIDSFNIISYFSSVALNSRPSYLKKYNFYYPDFFSLKYIFLEPQRVKNTNKKGGSPFSFHRQPKIKGQFLLQIIILRKETGASFKTNTSENGKVIKIAINSIRTVKVAFVTSF